MATLHEFGLTPRLPALFDHQVTGTYGECERMCYYKHILGRATPEEGYNLTWGKVFHAATEVWDQTHNVAAVHQVIEDGIPEHTDDKYGRNRARMQQLFVEWAAFQTMNPLRVLRTEQSVQVACLDGASCPYTLNGCGLVYGGRMDRIVEWNGIVGPLDYKTTTMDLSDPIAEYRPNHQMEGYVWAASHLMGRHCWGIIVEKLLCNKSNLRIDRFPVSFSRELIREWAENEYELQADLKRRFEEHAHNERAWKQNLARCSKPYVCEFREVCTQPRANGFRYKWLRDNTAERRWDFTQPDAQPSEVQSNG